ncbi:MAG: CDP-glycerol glycerophosphotransferase family protein [Bacteroidota bacterium]
MWRLTSLLTKTVEACFRTVSALIPKDQRLIVFQSVPDYADNARALHDYVRTQYPEEWTCVWLVEDRSRVDGLRKHGVIAHYRHSLAALRCLLRARYIVTTHSSMALLKSPRQVYVNLWHGMPLKAIGYADALQEATLLARLYRIASATDIIISTSANMRNAMATCFFIDPRRVYIVGQPRNDSLFTPREEAVRKLSTALQMEVADRRVIFWLPTFRSGLSRNDGEGIEAALDLKSLQELSEYLVVTHSLLVLKLHPLEERFAGQLDVPGIVLLRGEALKETLTDLYQVLPAADMLITDYSSAYFDYLLLQRPIVFFCNDLDSYRARRGFVLEPYEFWTPGPKVTLVSDLVAELERLRTDSGYYAAERALVNQLVNAQQDDRSSERVFEAMRALGEPGFQAGAK